MCDDMLNCSVLFFFFIFILFDSFDCYFVCFLERGLEREREGDGFRGRERETDLEREG